MASGRRGMLRRRRIHSFSIFIPLDCQSPYHLSSHSPRGICLQRDWWLSGLKQRVVNGVRNWKAWPLLVCLCALHYTQQTTVKMNWSSCLLKISASPQDILLSSFSSRVSPKKDRYHVTGSDSTTECFGKDVRVNFVKVVYKRPNNMFGSRWLRQWCLKRILRLYTVVKWEY